MDLEVYIYLKKNILDLFNPIIYDYFTFGLLLQIFIARLKLRQYYDATMKKGKQDSKIYEANYFQETAIVLCKGNGKTFFAILYIIISTKKG